MFYNTVIGWAVYYLFLSFRPVVPWKGCDNPWNTHCCFPINEHQKIAKVENFSRSSQFYQRKSDQSLIFRVHNETDQKSRVLIFDTSNPSQRRNNASQFFDSISEFYSTNIKFPDLNSLHQNFTFTNSSAETKILKWLKSYFVLIENHLFESPMPDISKMDFEKLAHDPGLLSNIIEQKIDQIYRNKSIDVILNCDQLMSNPTEEFYTRYLTEMHKSTGLEDLGSLKWQMIICLVVIFITVYFALWKGIKSTGKVIFFHMVN